MEQAEFLFEHEVAELTQDDCGIRLTTNDPDAKLARKGRDLIAAEGGRSAVRKLLGVDLEGYTHPEYFLVLATIFDFRSGMNDICSVKYTADPVEWFLSLEIPRMWRVVVSVDTSIEADDSVSDTYIQGCFNNLLSRGEPCEKVVCAIYRVSRRVAAHYPGGHALLASNAALINKPLGDMEFNGGLHDTVSLCGRLALVWHGNAPETVLDGYDAERWPGAVSAINAVNARNTKLMEEGDPKVRARNLENRRALTVDPERSHRYLLETSMIGPLRRSGMFR